MAGYEFETSPHDVEAVATANRNIHSKIPAPGTNEVLEKLKKYESRSMQGQLPIVWKKAENFNIYDLADNKYIDFTSTIFVTNTGHANAKLKERVSEVLNGDLVHTYAYANLERANYIEKLIKMTNGAFEKAFLLSAGTEATEAAVKLMRMDSMKKGKKRPGIICISGNWHGRTMGAQMLSDNAGQREWIGYDDPNIHHIKFPYEWDLDGADAAALVRDELARLEKEKGLDIKTDIAGFMLETFQGWGAVFYPNEFVQEIRRVCDESSLLLCFDEMQAGFARTGRLFGYEHYGVKADLICVGKGMGSGFPISGVLGSREVMDLPEVGNMSSTHSASPVVCAAADATLSEIQDRGLIERSEKLGKLFHEELNKLRIKYPEYISHIYGTGLLAAIIFRPGNVPICELPSRVSYMCMEKGLLVVHTGRESIKLAPPLTISEEALMEGLSVIEECMEKLTK